VQFAILISRGRYDILYPKGMNTMNRRKTEDFINFYIPLVYEYINRESFIYKYGYGVLGEEYVLIYPSTLKYFPLRKYYKKRILSVLGEKEKTGYYKIYLDKKT
jgi:hypothetical protein